MSVTSEAQTAPERRFYSTFEAAAEIGIHPAKLVRAYRSGRLAEPGRAMSRRVLTPADVAEARRVLVPGGGE